jgi:hypothetical protein
LEDIIVKHFLCLSKLAARMVTSTSSENLFYQRFELQNQNFDFETTKTLILHAWSIFFKGAHLAKLWSKKIFFMKSLSKLGALTVNYKLLEPEKNGFWREFHQVVQLFPAHQQVGQP